MNDWTSALNEGSGQVDVILLDFSKAFEIYSATPAPDCEADNVWYFK